VSETREKKKKRSMAPPYSPLSDSFFVGGTMFKKKKGSQN
jgi:hypothetical protein